MPLSVKTLHSQIKERETNAIYYLMRKFRVLKETVDIQENITVTGKYGKYKWTKLTMVLTITDYEPTTNYKITYNIINTLTKAVRTVTYNKDVPSSNFWFYVPTLFSNETLQSIDVEITYPQYIKQNPYQITVTADKPIIQEDETATLTAQLKYNGSAVSGKTLTYKILHGSTVIDSGSDTTNNQGKITITYTGTAVGQVDVIVTYGSLLIETFVLWDTIKYDNATQSSYNDSIWSSVSAMDRQAEQTSLSSTSATSPYITISGDITIEFDVKSVSTGSTSPIIGIRDNSNTILLSAQRNANLRMTSGEWYHIKITINDNQCVILNTTNDYNVNGDVTGYGRFYFRIGANEEIHFKNVKIYSV